MSASATPLTDAELLELLPEGAGEADLEGAVVTAEYFVQLYGEMLQSGDTSVWDALSTPDCAFCANASSSVREHFAAGDRVVGGDMRVDVSRTRARTGEDGTSYVGIVAEQSEASITAGENVGAVLAHNGEIGVALQLTQLGGVWRVLGVEVVAPEEIR